jgi:hypothetical protein
VLQTSLLRRVARDCLVTVETNRYAVPAAYRGQMVEGQWGADATVQLSHHGTLIAPHRRVDGQPQRCVDPAHYARRRQRSPPPAAGNGAEGALHLASWTGPGPAVAVRALAVYDALVGPEVSHD